MRARPSTSWASTMADGATRVVRSLGVAAAGEAAFFELAEALPAEGECWVDTLYSGLSAGTELSFLKGTNPYLHARWDDQLGVFVPGEPTTRFPVQKLGYMEVARVAESRTDAVAAGDVVAMAYGHKTGHCAALARDFVVALPSDLDPVLGTYVAQMGPICANGLLHAATDAVGRDVRSLDDGVRGRNVLVTGAGVVGLLTGLFAAEHGAVSVAVADGTPERLAAVGALGLEAVDERRVEAWQWCKQQWRHGVGDRGADVVFQCRGRPSSLQTALRSSRPQGVVVDLAFYQEGAADVRLGEEFHHNGLTIRCAQIARVPRGLDHLWNRSRLAAETIALLRARGADLRRHVVTDVVSFDDAVQVVGELAERRRHAIQVVFAFESSGLAEGPQLGERGVRR
jgi:threonine dehydrogenase-like Zn-dependent dehydrogenase